MPKKLLHIFLLTLLIAAMSSCSSAKSATVPATSRGVQPIITPTVKVSRSCPPTLDDGVSPSYKPDTPERNVVGSGHVLSGVVLSSVDCQPIANAKLEFWPEEAGLGHPDSSRATFYTDEQGQYRFECNQPEHIHMRISAEGYKTIGVNSYHPEGATEGTFDIILTPG